MKIKIKPRKNKEKWHSWFAWRPVKVGYYIIWLELVMRKITYSYCGDNYYTAKTEYRLLK